MYVRTKKITHLFPYAEAYNILIMFFEDTFQEREKKNCAFSTYFYGRFAEVILKHVDLEDDIFLDFTLFGDGRRYQWRTNPIGIATAMTAINEYYESLENTWKSLCDNGEKFSTFDDFLIRMFRTGGLLFRLARYTEEHYAEKCKSAFFVGIFHRELFPFSYVFQYDPRKPYQITEKLRQAYKECLEKEEKMSQKEIFKVLDDIKICIN